MVLLLARWLMSLKWLLLSRSRNVCASVLIFIICCQVLLMVHLVVNHHRRLCTWPAPLPPRAIMKRRRNRLCWNRVYPSSFVCLLPVIHFGNYRRPDTVKAATSVLQVESSSGVNESKSPSKMSVIHLYSSSITLLTFFPVARLRIKWHRKKTRNWIKSDWQLQSTSPVMKALLKLPSPKQKKALLQNMKQRLRLGKSGSFLHISLLIALSTNNLSSTSTAQESPTQIVKVEVMDQKIVQVEDRRFCTICPTNYTRGPAYAPSDLHDPETDKPIFLQPHTFQSMFEEPVLGYVFFSVLFVFFWFLL